MGKQLRGYQGACQFIFKHYGQSAQYKKLIEEMAELTKAICKGSPDNFIEELSLLYFSFEFNDRTSRGIYKMVA